MTRPLSQLCVKPDGTVLDAMRVINEGGQAVAFVCGGRGRVHGLLTDGDLRRALLDGEPLDSRCLMQVMRRDFARVSPVAGRAEALDLMRARHIEQLPVIDDKGRLIGLHTLHDLLGARVRPNIAVIMAGGRGTRLYPLTQHLPKPMITVAGRPILERLVLHLVGYGIRRVYLSVNYLADMIESHFGDGSTFGCEIRYLRETTPLGTGGPLALITDRPAEPMLVMNGDLVTQVDVGRLLDFHSRGHYVATFGLRTHSIEVPFGVATVRNDRVIALREKPTERLSVNAGIYVIEPSLIDLIPRDRDFPITELFATCLRRRLALGAHMIEDEWADVGRPQELSRARGAG